MMDIICERIITRRLCATRSFGEVVKWPIWQRLVCEEVRWRERARERETQRAPVGFMEVPSRRFAARAGRNTGHAGRTAQLQPAGRAPHSSGRDAAPARAHLAERIRAAACSSRLLDSDELRVGSLLLLLMLLLCPLESRMPSEFDCGQAD